MAKRKRSNRRQVRKKTRDAVASVIATRAKRVRFRPLVAVARSPDLRYFHPSRLRARLASGPKVATVGASPSSSRSQKALGSFSRERVSFHSPRKVMVCVRRKERREVLFAKGVGGSRQRKRKPKWSEYSSIACR